jgi:threonine dehydrogenase-like Zn-dependent dehydrogenase
MWSLANFDDGMTAKDQYARNYDVVVDATGSPVGLSLAAALTRPMGTLVLKSTCAAVTKFNAAPFVIDELKVVGSRCGPVGKALECLNSAEQPPLNVSKYITKTFPLQQAEEAIRVAADKSTMKVQIICSSS